MVYNSGMKLYVELACVGVAMHLVRSLSQWWIDLLLLLLFLGLLLEEWWTSNHPQEPCKQATWKYL